MVDTTQELEVIQTDKAAAPIGPYSQAIRANGFVFVAGEKGIDPNTNAMVAGGVPAETRQTLENIRNILEEAGSSISRVVATTVYLTDINAFLATDSGRAFAGQTMRMWVDPDVMRSMMQAMPHMIGAMPGAMIRLEAETAHLPKPKKKAVEKKREEREDEPDA